MIHVSTKHTTNFHVLCAALCVGALLLAFASTAQAQGRTDDCQAQRQQILSQFDRLPSDLHEIGLLPRTEAKLVFSALANERKTSLWREHLSQYLAFHPELSPPQRDVLLDALTLVDQGLFEVDRSQETLWKALHEDLLDLDARIHEVFGGTQAIEAFSSLGPHPEPNRDRLIRRSLSDGVTATGGLCSCATDSDYCWAASSGSTCKRTTACTIDPNSCGTFWAFDCNGLCFN